MTDSPIHHSTFVIERVYDAALPPVWKAFSDPAARQRWFVKGDGFSESDYSFDFRQGGREHGRFHVDAIKAYVTNETAYFDVIDEQRVIFSYAMAMDGQPPFSVSMVTAEFFAEGGSTRLRFTEQGAYLKSDQVDHAAMREEGQNHLLGMLGREIAGELK